EEDLAERLVLEADLRIARAEPGAGVLVELETALELPHGLEIGAEVLRAAEAQGAGADGDAIASRIVLPRVRRGRKLARPIVGNHAGRVVRTGVVEER